MFGNAGKTVYGSGSFAPTRGAVSAQGAQGYLKRNLTQRVQKNNFGRPGFNGVEGQRVGAMRVGNDGQSDTRSGVAQAGLNRMGQNMQAPDNRPKPPGQRRPRGGTGGGKPVPHVTINKTGQIKLPYDAGYSDDIYNSLADFNDQLMQLQIASQQQASGFGRDMRDENQGFQQQQMRDLNTDAGAGMAFSSRYATDVGNTADMHQNNVNDLTSQNTQFNQQVAAQRAAIQDAFNQQLQAAAQNRSRSLYDRAGSLGFGKAKVTKGGHAKPPKGKGHHKGPRARIEKDGEVHVHIHRHVPTAYSPPKVPPRPPIKRRKG